VDEIDFGHVVFQLTASSKSGYERRFADDDAQDGNEEGQNKKIHYPKNRKTICLKPFKSYVTLFWLI
jgi:hypothetical protein